jgi:hypothetical protein
MERFNIQKPNNVKIKEQYQVKISQIGLHLCIARMMMMMMMMMMM